MSNLNKNNNNNSSGKLVRFKIRYINLKFQTIYSNHFFKL